LLRLEIAVAAGFLLRHAVFLSEAAERIERNLLFLHGAREDSLQDASFGALL